MAEEENKPVELVKRGPFVHISADGISLSMHINDELDLELFNKVLSAAIAPKEPA